MPSIADNLKYWGDLYAWPDDGDEWSQPWGGVQAQWERVILPRIAPFLRGGTILEIAPGHGRWTQFLRHHCARLLIVDLSPRCIEFCARRFADSPHVECVVNDGLSLQAADDGTVDFVFSFDSLVHVEQDVITTYLAEVHRVLRPDGACVIHHSNLAECRLPQGAPRASATWNHWRAVSVSATSVRRASPDVGLYCQKQELINWRDVGFLLDCISTLRRTPPLGGGACEITQHMQFMPAG